jgi:hypothetical protein
VVFFNFDFFFNQSTWKQWFSESEKSNKLWNWWFIRKIKFPAKAGVNVMISVGTSWGVGVFFNFNLKM